MAKKVQTIIVSDISGDEASNGETVDFAYRGVSYAIDLTEQEAKKFDKAMEFYTAHAQRQGRRRSTASGKTKTDPGRLQAVREWARAHGHKVSDRGRISNEIQDAYDAAH